MLAAIALPVAGLRLVRQDRTSERPEHRALRPPRWRVGIEGGVVVLAGTTLWLLAQRDVPAGTVDPVVSLTPLIVAAAAGLVTFRVLPYLIAATVSWAGRLRGVATFVAAARSARGLAIQRLPWWPSSSRSALPRSAPASR